MSIHVALHHKTRYRYDRRVALSPHIVRLRPAPHCRTPVLSYSLTVAPSKHFINWQQDPHGNYLARIVFPEQTRELSIDVDLGKPDTLVGIVRRNLVEHGRQLLARPAPFGPEVENHQCGHRWMDDVAFEALDRFALGFGEAQGRHGAGQTPFNSRRVAPIWAAPANPTSGDSSSLAGARASMLGARLTSAGPGSGDSSERA